MIAPRPEGMSSPQPPTSLPKPKRPLELPPQPKLPSKRPKKTTGITFLPLSENPTEPASGHQPQTPQTFAFAHYDPEHPGSTSRMNPSFNSLPPRPNPEKPPVGSLPHQPEPSPHRPQTNMPPAPPPKTWYSHPYSFSYDPAPPPPAPRSFVESPLIVERELLEHNDQRTKFAPRATVRELLTAPTDDLD